MIGYYALCPNLPLMVSIRISRTFDSTPKPSCAKAVHNQQQAVQARLHHQYLRTLPSFQTVPRLVAVSNPSSFSPHQPRHFCELAISNPSLKAVSTPTLTLLLAQIFYTYHDYYPVWIHKDHFVSSSSTVLISSSLTTGRESWQSSQQVSNGSLSRINGRIRRSCLVMLWASMLAGEANKCHRQCDLGVEAS